MKSNYEQVKAWRKANPDKVAAQARRRYAKHKDRIDAYRAAWRRKNLDRVRPMDAASARKRRRSDPAAQAVRNRRFKERRDAQLVTLAGRPRPDICELCNLPPERSSLANRDKLVWDHDHATGKFRGWLCDRCNRSLGQVKDDIRLLLKMVDYLTYGGPHGASDNQAA